jgi:hypothetical protein
MTNLPENLLPTNNKVVGQLLSTAQLGTIPSNLLSSTTNQLTSQLSTYTSQLSNVNGQINNVLTQVESLSVGARARLAIIEEAIPDSLFTTPTTPGLSLTDIPDIEVTEATINEKVNLTTEALNNKIPNIPQINVTGLIGTALASLQPKIELPNIAEIKEVVYNKIKNLKRKQQAAIKEAQLQEAILEETPFTARMNNKEKVNSSILNRSRGIYG